MRVPLGIVAALLVSAPTLVRAQDLPLDPEVKVGKLPNGFTYYLRRYPHPAGKVEMRLVVKAGVLHEDPDQREFPHLIEHMAFNGSTHFPGDSFREFANKAGWKGGREWNANTGIVTRYALTLPTDRPELYDTGFVIMRDWAQGLTLDPKQVDAERGVVLAEGRNSDGAELRLATEMNARLLNHPLYPPDIRRRSDENLRSGKQSALQRFYRDWYRPDLEMLTVVGDIDVAQAETKIRTLFADMTMPSMPRSAQGMVERFAVPLTGENKFLTLFDPALTSISVRMYMKKPARSGASLVSGADYRSALVDDFYDRMMRNRLAQLMARYGVTTKSFDSKIDRRAFRQQAAIDALRAFVFFDRAEDIESGVKEMLQALEQVKRQGFLDSEFAQAGREIREELVRADETTSEDLAMAYAWHFSDGAAALAPGEARALRLRLLDEIALEDVNDLAREWIRTDRNFDVVFVAPTSERGKIPSKREFLSWIDEAQKGRIEPFVVVAPIEQLMSDAQVGALTAGVITQTSPLDEIGAVRLTLGNGITVLLKPVDDPVNGDKVGLTAFRAGGLAGYTVEDRASARALSGVVANSGVGPYDKFALQSFLDRHFMWAFAGIGDRMAEFNAVSPNSQVESLMQLAYLYFTAPRNDPEAFADWQDKQQRSRSAQISGEEQFRRIVDEERFASPKEPSGVVDAARVQAIYRDRFLQPGDFTFVVSGNVSVDAMMPLVRKYIGALPSARSAMNPAAQGTRAMRLTPVNRTILVGNENASSIALYFSGRYADSTINRLKLELLSSAIHVRLHERLREKEGGTYGIGVNPELTRPIANEPGYYSFGVYFATAPAEAQRLVKIAQEEVARLGAEGLDEDLFASVVGQIRSGSQLLLGRATNWDDYLVEQALRNADPGEALKREAYLNHILTREVLNAAAREFLGASVPQTFIRLPETRRAKR